MLVYLVEGYLLTYEIKEAPNGLLFQSLLNLKKLVAYLVSSGVFFYFLQGSIILSNVAT